MVTGLPEDPGSDDCSEFLKLCETHLLPKPSDVSDNMVTSTACSLCHEIPLQLSYLDLRVFRAMHPTCPLASTLTTDLTPTEAKLAFDARERQKQAQPRTAAATTVPVSEASIVRYDANVTTIQPSVQPHATITLLLIQRL